jgi:hypothetical protein
MLNFSNYTLHCIICHKQLSGDEISYCRRWLNGKLLCYKHQPSNKKV